MDGTEVIDSVAGLAQPGGAPVAQQQPAAGTESPVSPDGRTDSQQDGNGQVPKTFTQAEVDKVVSDRIAKAEAKAERRVLRILEQHRGPAPQQQSAAQPGPSAAESKPQRAQYASDDAYIDALTDWKLDQREAARNRETAQQQARSLHDRTEGIYAEAAKIPGFDRDAFESLPLTPAIAQAVIDSDVQAKLMAHMAANPDDVARIAKLSPARQAAEIGKLEARLATAKPPPRPSGAPAPIDPVGSGGSGVSHGGNRSSMSNEEYRALRKKEGAAWARR